MQTKFRCYHFNNFYFNGVHAGIQSHHSFMEIFNKVKDKPDSQQYRMLDEWSSNHKTVIVLNGGMQFNLEELEMFFDNMDNPFPWASFREGKEATNESLTNIGIVLPDYIYEISRFVANNHPIVLKNQGKGDGISFSSGKSTIDVVDGGIMLSFSKEPFCHPLIKSKNENNFTCFTIKNRFYSDFEVELMARLSMYNLF